MTHPVLKQDPAASKAAARKPSASSGLMRNSNSKTTAPRGGQTRGPAPGSTPRSVDNPHPGALRGSASASHSATAKSNKFTDVVRRSSTPESSAKTRSSESQKRVFSAVVRRSGALVAPASPPDSVDNSYGVAVRGPASAVTRADVKEGKFYSSSAVCSRVSSPGVYAKPGGSESQKRKFSASGTRSGARMAPLSTSEPADKSHDVAVSGAASAAPRAVAKKGKFSIIDRRPGAPEAPV